MARGPSNRVVVELDVDLKHSLYAALATEGITLKDWLQREAVKYVLEHAQPSLFAVSRTEPASS